MNTWQIREIINQVLEPLRIRVFSLIARGIIEAVNDSGGLQRIKMSGQAGEDRDGFERFQNFGFTSNPHPGAEGVVLFPNGNREHGLVIVIDDKRLRLKDLPTGGAAIYSTSKDEIKTLIKVLPDGNIEIGKELLEKIVNGETFKTLYNAHKHTGNSGVPTGPPITEMGDAHLSSKVKAAK